MVSGTHQPNNVYARAGIRDGLAELAERQHGVCSRSQLATLGIDADMVARQLRQERWSPWGSRVVTLQNAPLDVRQLRWAAVLHCGPSGALTGLSALQDVGLSGFDDGRLHAVVPRGVKVPRRPGLKVHELRRYSVTMRHPIRLPPQVPAPLAAVDAAVLQRSSRFAAAVVAATVQQRLTVAAEIAAALLAAGAVRHRRLLLAHLIDISGGSEALSELDLIHVCRRFGLAEPRRQTCRLDEYGRRRYHDAEWELPDGSIVVLEVDGAHHMEIEQWTRDLARDRFNRVAGRCALRCTNFELRTTPATVANDLIAAGVPRIVSRRAGKYAPID